jgi:tetratricopeptide (TPR) repeat protein
VYHKIKEYNEAISDYTKAIEIDPTKVDAYFNRGLIYGDSDKHTKVLIEMNKVIELDPKYAKAYECRGLSNAFLGKTGEAKKDLQKAVELDPDLKEKIKEISDKFELGL